MASTSEKTKKQKVILVIKHRMTWIPLILSSLVGVSKKVHSHISPCKFFWISLSKQVIHSFIFSLQQYIIYF